MRSPRSPLLAAIGAVTTLAAAVVTTAIHTAPASAALEPVVFGYTGVPQHYVVPPGLTLLPVEVLGAAGDAWDGGLGGRTTATIVVVPGEILTIHVGGAGLGAAGGWNGGGNGTANGSGVTFDGGGGGGASDIRRGTGLADRIVVAGGGGGGTAFAGGSGGGTSAQPGDGTAQVGYGEGGGGGTSAAGGAGGTAGTTCPCGVGMPGSVGAGGAASDGGGYGSGGGGGGYFGGGGGGHGANYGGGGGGGSSYAAPTLTTDATHLHGVTTGAGEVRIGASLEAPNITASPEPAPTVDPLPQPTVVPSPPSGGLATSDDCAVVAGDGYVGTTYVRLATQQVDSRTTWVCVRLENGVGVGTGGKFVVTQPDATSSAPTADGAATQCATAPGNTVPGPHPMLPGSVGDPSDPSTHMTYLIDAYAGNGAAWVCARVTAGAEAFALRVVVPVPSIGVPAVTFLPDAPGQYGPARAVHPAGPSGTCQTETTGTRAEYANVSSALGNVWLGSWQESATRVHVCVGAGGLRPSGGRVTIEVPLPTVSPVITRGSDMAACPLSVAQQGGVAPFAIRRSGATNPASVCVEVAGSVVTVTLGANATAGVPTVTWAGDPGTP